VGIYREYPRAGIHINSNGCIEINAIHTRSFEEHENVQVTIEGDHISVRADKVIRESTFLGTNLTPDMVIEEDTTLVRSRWFGKKDKRIVKEATIVELKEREHRVYSSNNYVIIE
jgi:hypothetical protein